MSNDKERSEETCPITEGAKPAFAARMGVRPRPEKMKFSIGFVSQLPLQNKKKNLGSTAKVRISSDICK